MMRTTPSYNGVGSVSADLRLAFEPRASSARGDQYVASCAGALFAAIRLIENLSRQATLQPRTSPRKLLCGEKPELFTTKRRASPGTAQLKVIERAVSDPTEIVQ